jgi:uncharacterized membrane protein
MQNKQARALAKAITWRISASLITVGIALAFGLPAKAIGGVFIADMVIKFVMYYGHERLWQKLTTPFNNFLNNRKTR